MPISDFIIQDKELRALMRRRGAPRSETKKRKKSGFEVKWVKLPFRWIERLRGARGPTYDLAYTVLVENYKLDQMAVKEIVLSEQVTGLSRHIRQRAINNLVKRGLIRVR